MVFAVHRGLHVIAHGTAAADDSILSDCIWTLEFEAPGSYFGCHFQTLVLTPGISSLGIREINLGTGCLSGMSRCSMSTKIKGTDSWHSSNAWNVVKKYRIK
jgi:hypothetical protein